MKAVIFFLILILGTFQLSFLSALAHAESKHELTKEEALVLMKSHGYQWKQTELISEDAEAKSEQADSAFMPHLRLIMREYGTQVNPAQYGLPNYPVSAFVAGSSSLEMGYNLFDRESSERINAALANERIGSASKTQYQSDLTYLMLVQFLNVQRLRKKMEVFDANIERDQEILKVAESRVDAGLGTRLDLMRAKGLLEADNLKKLDSTILYSKALQELAITLGQSQLESEPGALIFKTFASKQKDYSVDRIIANRPDVLVAKATIEAADGLRKSARGEAYPKAAIFADFGLLGTGSTVFGVGGPVNGALGLQITVPIFSGGLIAGKTREQAVKVIQSELKEKSLELESRMQLNLALAHIKEAGMAVKVSQDQVTIAEDELKLVRDKFGTGAGNGFELSNSQVNYTNAQDSHIEAIFNHELAKVSFFKAVGSFDEYFKLDLESKSSSNDKNHDK